MSANQDLTELRKKIRHSTAHVMADVVTKMFPETQLAIGPPTDDGFYYDFMTSEPLTDQHLAKIEKRMKKTILQNLPFEYFEDSGSNSNPLAQWTIDYITNLNYYGCDEI